MSEWETVIGLEVHAQLKTASKLFCSCPTNFGAQPNTQVCEGCTAMPGALPRLNKEAVRLAIMAGLAVGCRINPRSVFARKSYFYPDLPDGYQLSQFDPPICGAGECTLTVQGKQSTIRINRIHLEDDAGKCVHGHATGTLVDLNRAGMGLIEIVTEPDIRSAEEAVAFLRYLHTLLVYLEVCDGNMEEGSFRCDVNVSIRPKGQKEYGTRSEIKNINSFRHVQRAVEVEVERHKSCHEDGIMLQQETRLFDPIKQITLAMRSKEEALDYRYFPDPDLPAVELTEADVAAVRAILPELPAIRQQRYQDSYGINTEEAVLLVADRQSAEYFEASLAIHPNAKRIATLMVGAFLPECSRQRIRAAAATMQPQQMAELARCVDEGLISLRIANELFAELFATGTSVHELAKQKNVLQVSDSSALEAIVDAIILANPEEAEAYRAGKTKLLSFFVGQAMRQTKGTANPGLVNEIVQQRLG